MFPRLLRQFCPPRCCVTTRCALSIPPLSSNKQPTQQQQHNHHHHHQQQQPQQQQQQLQQPEQHRQEHQQRQQYYFFSSSSSSSSSRGKTRGRMRASVRDPYDPPLRASRAAEERHLWRGVGGKSSSWSPYFFPQPGRVDTTPQPLAQSPSMQQQQQLQRQPQQRQQQQQQQQQRQQQRQQQLQEQYRQGRLPFDRQQREEEDEEAVRDHSRTLSPPSQPQPQSPPSPPQILPPVRRTLDSAAGRLLLTGYTVPYKFRITDLPPATHRGRPAAERPGVLNRHASPYLEYVDFAQNRFPVLDTAENVRYWKDTGMGRVLPRVFPLKLPAYRRVDPLLRELIFFLHSMDPARFSLRKIAERYGLKERTVEKIYKEFSVADFLRRTELATPSTRRLSREKAVLGMKEVIYKLKLGYDQLGDEELDEQEENEFRGWRSTQDWIHRQQVEVEMMSAFPLPGKRDPLPKRVDVDVTVHNTPTIKVMNWIDPSDKLVF